MKLNTVIDFSKWHTITEMPKINTHILFCDEKGIKFYHGIILKKSGYMFFDSFMNKWNKIIEYCNIKYWIYMSEIDVKK